MALRAFHSNPGLGGFGGESGAARAIDTQTQPQSALASEEDCDAFAQIVKELVDNAVDACSKPRPGDRRVRVLIQSVRHTQGGDEEYSGDDHVLRVTVSDNGCGMTDIQRCVDVFRTTKASSDTAATQPPHHDDQTAGRYGLGLTLCILHAQRLVPDSCASITSATHDQQHYTRANYVVDKQVDSVRCVHQEHLPKTSPQQSGTAVSLLVPGGPTAQAAWPRLAEYFARFQLSLQLKCRLEVQAPSLSTVPLFVRPATQQQRYCASGGDDITSHKMVDKYIDDTNSDDLSSLVDTSFSSSGAASALLGPTSAHDSRSINNRTQPGFRESPKKHDDETAHKLNHRKQLRSAAQSYLMRNVELKNVAHASHRIGRGKRAGQGVTPTLEVCMIVHGSQNTDGLGHMFADSDDDEGAEQAAHLSNEQDDENDVSHGRIHKHSQAKLSLVRMINQVPLLDGAEAAACGLVQGIYADQASWNSVGLHITPTSEMALYPTGLHASNAGLLHEDRDDDEEKGLQSLAHLCVPVFSIRDSDQVAPFFQHRIHAPFEGRDESVDDDSSQLSGNRRAPIKLLPACVRLGEILLVVQINAEPLSLPLPTLSKGRLPLNNNAINNALQLGIIECLRSLQTTNPQLLLTSQQLKDTVRDTRYIPAVSASLASIVSKSQNSDLRASLLQSMAAWKDETTSGGDTGPLLVIDDGDIQKLKERQNFSVTAMVPVFERRLRFICCRKTGVKVARHCIQDDGRDSEEKIDELQGIESVGFVYDTHVQNAASRQPDCVSFASISEEAVCDTESVSSCETSAMGSENSFARQVCKQGKIRVQAGVNGDNAWW